MDKDGRFLKPLLKKRFFQGSLCLYTDSYKDFMSLYDGVFRVCTRENEYTVYISLQEVLHEMYMGHKQLTFLSDPVLRSMVPSEWCEIMFYLKQVCSRHIAQHILALALQPSDEQLWSAGRLVVRNCIYMERYWIARNREWVVWGDEMIKACFSFPPRGAGGGEEEKEPPLKRIKP